jgi:hypothetical protein
MDIKWAAKRLEEGNPVRRDSWDVGSYIGNKGGLFWCCAHEETYNSPSVSINYSFSLTDIAADDWEEVIILEPYGWHLVPPNHKSGWQNPEFFLVL